MCTYVGRMAPRWLSGATVKANTVGAHSMIAGVAMPRHATEKERSAEGRLEERKKKQSADRQPQRPRAPATAGCAAIMMRPGTGMVPGTGMAPMTGMRTAMGTAAGGIAGFGAVRDGKATEQIYSMIREGRYQEAINVLTTKQLEFPTSRAAQSLLAYCYYYTSDFQSSLQCYEQLMKMCPDVDEYKLYYAQALFKAGHYEPALKACQAVSDAPALANRVLQLQAAIKYEQEDMMNTRALIDQCPLDDAVRDLGGSNQPPHPLPRATRAASSLPHLSAPPLYSASLPHTDGVVSLRSIPRRTRWSTRRV